MTDEAPLYNERIRPTVTTGLERITAKAQTDANLKFTSLAHHITPELVRQSLYATSNDSAAGVDKMSVEEAKETFDAWIGETISEIQRQGYQPPPVRRVYIPKPGKAEKRPIGVPSVIDRAVQRSTATVISAIYEEDFLKCSFGGRPGIGAHNALCTMKEIIAGRKTDWVFEADIKNFFGAMQHKWILEFIEHRIADPRIICLISEPEHFI